MQKNAKLFKLNHQKNYQKIDFGTKITKILQKTRKKWSIFAEKR